MEVAQTTEIQRAQTQYLTSTAGTAATAANQGGNIQPATQDPNALLLPPMTPVSKSYQQSQHSVPAVRPVPNPTTLPPININLAALPPQEAQQVQQLFYNRQQLHTQMHSLEEFINSKKQDKKVYLNKQRSVCFQF